MHIQGVQGPSAVRLWLWLWFSGMVGAVMVAWTVIPGLLASTQQTVAPMLAVGASISQSAVLLGLLVWAGVRLSPSLGLGVPLVAAWLGKRPCRPILQTIWPAALVAGSVVAMLLLVFAATAPESLRHAATIVTIPIGAKLLYGGITEELLMRYGVMTLLVWLPWRLWQRQQGLPKPTLMMSAIFGSAMLFGLGHLPAVVAFGVELTPEVLVYIMLGNVLPGLIFGWLYWRRGLEAAMVAHALAHALSTLLSGVLV